MDLGLSGSRDICKESSSWNCPLATTHKKDCEEGRHVPLLPVLWKELQGLGRLSPEIWASRCLDGPDHSLVPWVARKNRPMLVAELTFKENGGPRDSSTLGCGMQIRRLSACLACTEPLVHPSALHTVCGDVCQQSQPERGGAGGPGVPGQPGPCLWSTTKSPQTTPIVCHHQSGLWHGGTRAEMSRPGQHCRPAPEPGAGASCPL